MKSEAQRAYLHANLPDVAERFESETERGKKLPRHAKRKKTARKKGGRKK